MTSELKMRRVLVVDDEAPVLDAYRRVLEPLARTAPADPTAFDALSAEIFGPPETDAAVPLLDEIVYCRQGEQAVRAVEEAQAAGNPFCLVFLDMRMPPGIDGLETAQRIRALDQHVNLVIVTGYSDHRPADVTAAVGRPDKLFYLVKPFNADELQQLTTALANRWSVDVDAAEELARRILELEAMNAALKASEAGARQAARSDALTGLSNRAGLSERFPAGQQSTGLSVVYIDLDRFKNINDTLGHVVGDELIREFARRVREATGEDGFAARLGGDEFAVICKNPAKVPDLTRRLLAAGEKEYVIDGHRIRATASIGYAHSEPGRPDLIDAMRRADMALYAAKAAGRGVIREFDPDHERELFSTQRLAHDLARAIADDSLMLHYQPIVEAAGIPVCGVEALLRWQHPTQGLIPPLVFIAAAEKTDLIRELGDWVIRRAFADARNWPDLITSINLSPAQFDAPGFVEEVARLAVDMGIDPAKFEFEVTETALMADVARATASLHALKELGFRIALDDFGSGFAGIAYLKHIRFDRLKIDQSFVQDLSLTQGAPDVIKSIIGLAHAMGLSITAEGVEDAAQHVFLKDAGCSQMQGFLFHKPQSVDSIIALRGRATAARLAAAG